MSENQKNNIQEERTPEEILQAINGLSEKNGPKATVTFTNELENIDTDKVKTLSSKSLFNPEVLVQPHGEYIQIDFIFKKASDVDIKILWKVFEKYGLLLGTLNEKSKEIPVNSVVIIPTAFDEQYFLIAENPIFWTLQPTFPGKEITMIRTLFEQKNVNICKADFDIDELQEAEAKKIEMENEFQLKVSKKENNPYDKVESSFEEQTKGNVSLSETRSKNSFSLRGMSANEDVIELPEDEKERPVEEGKHMY